MSKLTQNDLESLPHVTLTSDVECNPTQFDEDWDLFIDEPSEF